MSVLFLPPSAGAASVPDASETVSGKIRIATSAEATAGTNDLTAMTPAKTKSVVDAAVVGGVTYQGTFDASSPADLSNATKGDLYIISVAGTYQGQTWAVGDHLLINADMGGTLDPAKIDKVDNTDSVTSVAGRTGAVTLSTADISGLATVASTGAYSDLTGVPTLGTAAAEDVGTSAGNVVQLDGTAKLPAVDGSQLTNLPSAPVTSVAGKTGAVTLVAGDISGLATVATTGAYSDLTGTPTLGTAAAEDVGTLAGNVVQLDGSARLPAVDGSLLTGITASVAALNDIGDVTITSPSNGEALIYNSTSGDWENGTVSASVATLNDIGDVSAAAPSDTNVIKYNSTSGDWESGAVAYSEVTGTPTLGTAAAEDVGTSAGNVVQLDGSARLPAVDGSQLTNLPSSSVAALNDIGDVTITSAADGQFLKYDSGSSAWVNADSGLYESYTFLTSGTIPTPNQAKTITARMGSVTAQTLTLPTGSADLLGSTIYLTNNNTATWTISPAAGQYIRGLSSAPTLTQDQALILTLVFNSTWYVVAYEEQGLGSLADVSIASPSNGEALVYNSTSGDWENGTFSVASLTDIGGVNVTGAVATNVLKYDGANWVDGAVAYSEVTGTPTLGTAAALDVGTSANNIVQLDGSARLPAVDGSQLTNLPTGGSRPNVTPATPGATYTISTSTGIEEAYLLTPSTACAVTIPTASSAGSGYKYQIKNLSANTVTISPSSGTIDGSGNFSLNVQYATVTLLSDGSNWFVI